MASGPWFYKKVDSINPLVEVLQLNKSLAHYFKVSASVPASKQVPILASSGGVNYQPNKPFSPQIAFDQGLWNSKRNQNITEISARGTIVVKIPGYAVERLWRISEILVENVFECSELNDLWELEDTVENSELDGKKIFKGKRFHRSYLCDIFYYI